MASRIRADRSANENGSKRAKDNAEKAFKAKTAATAKEPKVLEALASERDAQHHKGIIARAEKKHEASCKEAAALKTESKTTLDKAYADAADALKSRGITKRILKAEYEDSRRKDDERLAETSARLWYQRATGVKQAQQTFMFDAPVGGAEDAKKRARQAGFDASAEGKSSIENPYAGHAEMSQAFLAGYHEHQGEAAKRAFGKGEPEGERPN